MWFQSTELLVLLNPEKPFLSCVKKTFLRTEEMRSIPPLLAFSFFFHFKTHEPSHGKTNYVVS